MKLLQNKIKFKRIFELHLIKSKIYKQTIEKNTSTNFLNTNLAQTILNFKKALRLIFNYHQIKKRILFLGVPTETEVRLNSTTQHIAISNSIKTKKLFNLTSEGKSNFNSLKNNKNIFSKLKKKPDLIVVISNDSKTKFHSIIEKAYILKTPIIEFSETMEKHYWKNFYTVLGNLKLLSSNKQSNNIFAVFIKAIMKKTKFKILKTPLKKKFYDQQKKKYYNNTNNNYYLNKTKNVKIKKTI